MRLNLCLRAALAVAAILVISIPTASAATIVFSDSFTKSDGALVGTTPDISTGNWTQTGTTATNPIQISGNAVQMGTTGQDTYAAFSNVIPHTDGTVLHTSMDINVSAAQTGDYFSHLSDPVGTTASFHQRLGAAASGAGYVLQLAETGGGGATTLSGTTVLNFNQSYHVDINWTFVPGATNDTFDVFVDNSSYLSKTWTSTNAEPTQLSAVNLRQGGTTSSATLKIDNLQVDVPEPGTVGLACGLLLIGAGASRRRRA
jgi:hypothetical protein